MVWDRTKPANTEKIRNLGIVIRPNWKAVEQASDNDADAQKIRLWAVNLYDRNNAAVTGAATPGRIDDAGQIYCRVDAADDPKMELFFEDQEDPSNETQLTQAGSLGSLTTNLNTQNISFDGTYQNTQNGFVSAWALVAANGGLIAGYGLTSARNDTGDYTITITDDLSSANYAVTGNIKKSNTRARVLWVYAQAEGSFSLRTQAINASAGNYEDNIFMISVFGGR